MAEVPDINPMRPIWPARPDERSTKRKRPIEGERNDQRSNEKKHHKDDENNNKGSGEGHLDEYV